MVIVVVAGLCLDPSRAFWLQVPVVGFGFLEKARDGLNLHRHYLLRLKADKSEEISPPRLSYDQRSRGSALGTWVFSVAGALLAIPVGIKRKSFGPLVFFGTTGTMLDIIMGITACEREHAERQMKLLEMQNPAPEASLDNAENESL